MFLLYLQVTMYTCGICEDFSFGQSVICKRHMTEQHSGFGWRCQKCRVVVSRPAAHKKCDGELKLVNRNTMTCTPSEEEVFVKFQKAREEKMIVKRVPFEKKEEITKDSKSKSHRKTEEKTVKRKICTLQIS